MHFSEIYENYNHFFTLLGTNGILLISTVFTFFPLTSVTTFVPDLVNPVYTYAIPIPTPTEGENIPDVTVPISSLREKS